LKGQAKRRRGSDCLSTCIDRPKVVRDVPRKIQGVVVLVYAYKMW